MNKKMKRNVFLAVGVLVVLIAAILLIVFIPSCAGKDNPADKVDMGIDMTRFVTDEGLHSATINTNSKGEIENNSYGKLIDKLPGDIEKITMRTQQGNYTFLLESPVNADGTTEATKYTLEGFEGYNLADTNPSLLAGVVCNIDFVKVADLSGENASEYGFDKPRAEATVYYNDSTYSVVRLGDDAPGTNYCYIQFGDSKTVYIVESTEVDSMLLKITDLFNTSINSDKTYISDENFDEIILGGTHLEKELSIKSNTDKSIDCAYVLSSNGNVPVNVTEGSSIVGAIKSITTDGVVCVNPDKTRLEDLGLLTPYATVKTTYVYTESTYDAEGNEIVGDPQYFDVSLLASQPDSDGNVVFMEEGGKLVYKIAASKLPWVTTAYEKLMSEYVLKPAYSALESIVLECGGKAYEFDLSTEKVISSDGDGSATEVEEPRVHLAGKAVDPDQFYVLFEDLTMMQRGGKDEETATKGELLKITYNYNTGRKSDTVVLYNTDSQKVVEQVNSEKYGYVYKSYVTALVSNIEALASGKEISKVS